MNIRSRSTSGIRRTLIALLLVFVLSFSAVFADDGSQDAGTTSDIAQTGTEIIDAGGDDQSTEEPDPEAIPESTEEPDPEAVPEGSIIQKGKYYFYKNPDGVIKKTAGFVTVGGKKYYVRKGGKIKTNATFKVKKKYYRAGKNGVIKTGIYKWNGKYSYSYSQGQWRRKAGFVIWKDNKYYVRKGGVVISNEGFIVKNIAYTANKKGHVTKVVLPEEESNAVIEVARKQVGKMTGKTYWVWYYKTKFVDTDRTPWCGAFVAWVYNKAGLYKKISVAKRFGPLGYVPSYSRYADRYKKWVKKKDAQAGDIIVFGRNKHVGLVEGVYGKYIITIEGNAGPTAVIGCGKPGAVVRRIYKYSDKKIKGVICVLKH